MRKYDYVIFDLDGTITEPAEGITNAIIYALKKYNIQVDDRSSLFKFIGPPLRDSFKEFYGFSQERAEEAVSFYREYYKDRGLIENELMPGIKHCLELLNKAGCKLCVATSKPEEYAIKILDNLQVLNFFDTVAGASLDGSRDKKELVMKYLFERLKEKYEGFCVDKAVMVGDRHFDIYGANYFKMESIGVTFGYGSKDELTEAGATVVLDSSQDIEKYILQNI
ncbi:MAG: HAD family hydrolase [Lachnospiraceae bacterium]|nr:HAD family hydrolase [Lachnospiraceae bacterium]